ncbi:hypothetical protein NL676_025760 [Syzygium grande]|nr:hypothetical protein NL676_025760 [Syzygium grande]
MVGARAAGGGGKGQWDSESSGGWQWLVGTAATGSTISNSSSELRPIMAMFNGISKRLWARAAVAQMWIYDLGYRDSGWRGAGDDTTGGGTRN